MSKVSERKNPVFTVGHEQNYDAGIKRHGRKFLKRGRSGRYPGGFACRTLEDAVKLIQEQNHREWAVYEVDADWDKDTVPSEHGWWHALIRDAAIIRKVSLEKYPRSPLPERHLLFSVVLDPDGETHQHCWFDPNAFASKPGRNLYVVRQIVDGVPLEEVARNWGFASPDGGGGRYVLTVVRKFLTRAIRVRYPFGKEIVDAATANCGWLRRVLDCYEKIYRQCGLITDAGIQEEISMAKRKKFKPLSRASAKTDNRGKVRVTIWLAAEKPARGHAKGNISKVMTLADAKVSEVFDAIQDAIVEKS